MKNWKSWIKGIYDTRGTNPKMLVIDSAKLDIYRKMGDSLAQMEGKKYEAELMERGIKNIKKLAVFFFTFCR